MDKPELPTLKHDENIPQQEDQNRKQRRGYRAVLRRKRMADINEPKQHTKDQIYTAWEDYVCINDSRKWSLETHEVIQEAFARYKGIDEGLNE